MEQLPKSFYVSKGYMHKFKKLKKNIFQNSTNRCSMKIITRDYLIQCLKDSNLNGDFGGFEQFIERFEGKDMLFGRYFDEKSYKFCLNFSNVDDDNYLIKYNKLEKIVEVKEGD